MADEAGIDFMLPIGRWKGYGGETDYQGATLETITWASGLLQATRRITVFGTVHAPLFHPIIAAKQMVTADHIGEGRFGLNIVVGWNEDEFEMFGVQQREHALRYEYAQEWIDVIKLIWSDRDSFDFDGRFIRLKAVRAKPKPYGGTRPVIMNAGASPVGRAFAVRNCDAFFMQASRVSVEETAQRVAAVKAEAAAHGREISVFTVGVITCRPTRPEAEDYHHYTVVEQADWSAVDNLLAIRKCPGGGVSAEEFQRQRMPLRARQQRTSDHRRSRPCRRDAHRAQPRGPHRHRRVARQLRRRAAVSAGRGAAAARARGVARAGVMTVSEGPLSARSGTLCGKKKDDAPFRLRASLM